MKRTTGHLTEKNGKWYAVINLYTLEGKRKEKWESLDLEAKRGTKTEATHRLNEVLNKYNSGDLYLMDSLTKAEQERRRMADMPFVDYLNDWVEQYSKNLSPTTLRTYRMMVTSRMVPFFEPLELRVRDITDTELNSYYDSIRESGAKGATAQRHHSLLHLALKQAVKRQIISSNPCDQADRPKAQQYIGDYYNAVELKALLDCLDGDPLKTVVILAAYYGLRRSEVLGLKWSAIDLDSNTICIRHKVVDVDNDLRGMDVMKTKSSYRTLPLIPTVIDELKAEKEHQAEMQRVMRSAYNRKYNEYICVDALGDLIRPQYATEHFKVILRQNELKAIRFHDLRHSCASLLLANGVPMKMIQDWLGHSNMSTTANFYSHLDSASKVNSANVIGNALK